MATVTSGTYGSFFKMNTVTSASSSFVWNNVWSQTLPYKAYFVIVDQEAINGSYSKNPSNFLNLASQVPMTIDVKQNLHVTPFVELFEGAEKLNKDLGLFINRKRFVRGYTIYSFNLAPSDFGERYMNLVRQGSVRLEIKFEENTTKTICCVAMAEFAALLEVDSSREVKYTQA